MNEDQKRAGRILIGTVIPSLLYDFFIKPLFEQLLSGFPYLPSIDSSTLFVAFMIYIYWYSRSPEAVETIIASGDKRALQKHINILDRLEDERSKTRVNSENWNELSTKIGNYQRYKNTIERRIKDRQLKTESEKESEPEPEPEPDHIDELTKKVINEIKSPEEMNRLEMAAHARITRSPNIVPAHAPEPEPEPEPEQKPELVPWSSFEVGWNKSADMMPSKPNGDYGHLDRNLSDLLSNLIVYHFDEEQNVKIICDMAELLPKKEYRIDICNEYTPFTKWSKLFSAHIPREKFVTDDAGCGKKEINIKYDLFNKGDTVSIWINEVQDGRTLLISDNFKVRTRAGD